MGNGDTSDDDAADDEAEVAAAAAPDKSLSFMAGTKI